MKINDKKALGFFVTLIKLFFDADDLYPYKSIRKNDITLFDTDCFRSRFQSLNQLMNAHMKGRKKC